MYKNFIHPKYAPTWLTIFALYVLSFLPLKALYPLGRCIGRSLYFLLRERREIVNTNIQLCFPTLSPQQHTKYCKEVFEENAIGLLEAAYSWWNNPKKIMHQVDFHGLELIDNALKKNNGLLLIGAHFTNLELAALIVGNTIDLDVTYRKQKNALIDQFIFNKRQRYFKHVIERSNFRQFFKNLKANRVIWYAPDQDYGAKHSVFADFFGIKAASIKATSKILNFNNSPALFLSHQRDKNNRYQITISEFSQLLPSACAVKDAHIINSKIEEVVRHYPTQYMWTHRRFKSRPNNEARLYKKKKSRLKKLQKRTP